MRGAEVLSSSLPICPSITNSSTLLSPTSRKCFSIPAFRTSESRRTTRTPHCLWNLFSDSTPPKKPSYHSNAALPSLIVEDTFLAGKELKCCYKASLDGFSAYNFHSCCDFQGPCFVVGVAETGFRFGGFNPLGFRGTDDYYETFKAFLFYWPDEQNSSPVILPKVGGSGAAIFDYARGGPQFGADGLLIGPPLVPVMGGFSGPDPNKGEGDLRQAKSRLGLSYARRPDGRESIFGEEKKVTLVEVEVFSCPAIADMY